MADSYLGEYTLQNKRKAGRRKERKRKKERERKREKEKEILSAWLSVL